MPKQEPQTQLNDQALLDEQKGPPPTQDPVKLSRYLEKLNRARDERALPRKEFDGMTFEQDYERNRECIYSYLRPKKNDDDVRVNSGTAEKKIELMLNELISMNFQPEVRAYDENDLEITSLGPDFTDLVRCTNEQETDEDLWEEEYIDLLSQRIAFVEECLTDSLPGGYSTSQKNKMRGVKRRISPLQVYFGDMYVPVRRFNEQPYIVIYDRMLYDEAKVRYGDIPEFKYVKPGSGIHDEYLPWFKYRFSELRSDEVEVIRYLSSAEHEDDEQVIINSVMMYPDGKKMTCRYGYPVKGAVVKPIPDFVYGKPPIASAKFLAALQDETLRNLIRKMRQAIEPPLGIKSGRIPTRDMWNPSAVTQGLAAENFSRLIDHQGVTTSEFQMLQLITQKTEEFIGSAGIQNQPGTGDMTATQVIELQKQAVKMIGTVILAITRLKRDCTFARLETILREYVKPTSTKILNGQISKKYRTFEISNATSEQGDTITKFINFIDRSLSQEELGSVMKAEDQASKQGTTVRHSFLNVKALEEMPILFKVTVNPEQRDSSSLDKVLFQDRINQAALISQLSGRQIAGDKLIADFERVWKMRGLFQDQALGSPGTVPSDPNAMLAGLNKLGAPTAQNGASGTSLPASQLKPQSPARPSINTLAQPA